MIVVLSQQTSKMMSHEFTHRKTGCSEMNDVCHDESRISAFKPRISLLLGTECKFNFKKRVKTLCVDATRNVHLNVAFHVHTALFNFPEVKTGGTGAI